MGLYIFSYELDFLRRPGLSPSGCHHFHEGTQGIVVAVERGIIRGKRGDAFEAIVENDLVAFSELMFR